MSEAMRTRAEARFQALRPYSRGMAMRHMTLSDDDSDWTTSDAMGSVNHVLFYMRLACGLAFPGGLKLDFHGNSGALGLGSTGSLGGRATFVVDPHTLKGAAGIFFEARDLNIGSGGFRITWYKDGAYIGHGAFYGAGAALGTPGRGAGTFS